MILHIYTIYNYASEKGSLWTIVFKLHFCPKWHIMKIPDLPCVCEATPLWEHNQYVKLPHRGNTISNSQTQ